MIKQKVLKEISSINQCYSATEWADGYNDGIRAARDAVIQMNIGSEWVPVSERLPEEKGEYLVTYNPCYWDDIKSETRVGIDTFRGKTTWAKKKYQRVTRWMPLPEPYKEGAE